MFFKKICLLSYNQLIVNKCHVGGLCSINISFKKYIFGFRNHTFLYELLHLRFFFKINLAVLMNSVNTYYDKILMVNSDLNYSQVFEDLCQKIHMPYLYSRWIAGSLTNFHFFSSGGALFKPNHFEGIYKLGFVPGIIVLLNGEHNRAILKEGRVLESLLFGIADYEPAMVSFSEIDILKNGYLNYPTLMNDDNKRALNLYLYFMYNAIYARKLLINNLIFFEFTVIPDDNVVPFFIGPKTFFKKSIGYKQGRICSFYKNRTKFVYYSFTPKFVSDNYFLVDGYKNRNSNYGYWGLDFSYYNYKSRYASEWKAYHKTKINLIPYAYNSVFINYNYSLFRYKTKRNLLEKVLAVYLKVRNGYVDKTKFRSDYNVFFTRGLGITLSQIKKMSSLINAYIPADIVDESFINRASFLLSDFISFDKQPWGLKYADYAKFGLVKKKRKKGLNKYYKGLVKKNYLISLKKQKSFLSSFFIKKKRKKKNNVLSLKVPNLNKKNTSVLINDVLQKKSLNDLSAVRKVLFKSYAILAKVKHIRHVLNVKMGKDLYKISSFIRYKQLPLIFNLKSINFYIEKNYFFRLFTLFKHLNFKNKHYNFFDTRYDLNFFFNLITIIYFLQFRVGIRLHFDNKRYYTQDFYYKWGSKFNYVLYNLYIRYKHNLLQNSSSFIISNDLLYYRLYFTTKVLIYDKYVIGRVKFLIKTKLYYASLVKYSRLMVSQRYNIIQYTSNLVSTLHLFNFNLLVRLKSNQDNLVKFLRFYDLRFKRNPVTLRWVSYYTTRSRIKNIKNKNNLSNFLFRRRHKLYLSSCKKIGSSFVNNFKNKVDHEQEIVEPVDFLRGAHEKRYMAFNGTNFKKLKFLNYNNDYVFLFHIFFNYREKFTFNFYKTREFLDSVVPSIFLSPSIVKILCVRGFKYLFNNLYYLGDKYNTVKYLVKEPIKYKDDSEYLFERTFYEVYMRERRENYLFNKELSRYKKGFKKNFFSIYNRLRVSNFDFSEYVYGKWKRLQLIRLLMLILVSGVDRSSLYIYKKIEYVNYNYMYSLYNDFDNMYLYVMLMCKCYPLQTFCSYNIFFRHYIKPLGSVVI